MPRRFKGAAQRQPFGACVRLIDRADVAFHMDVLHIHHIEMIGRTHQDALRLWARSEPPVSPTAGDGKTAFVEVSAGSGISFPGGN